MQFAEHINKWLAGIAWILFAALVGFSVGIGIAEMLNSVEEAMSRPAPKVEWPELQPTD